MEVRSIMREKYRKKCITFLIYLMNLVLILILLLPGYSEKSVTIQMQKGFLITYIITTFLHLLLVYKDKTWKLSILNILIFILFFAFHIQETNIKTIWNNDFIAKLIPSIVLTLTIAEYFIGQSKEIMRGFFFVEKISRKTKHKRLFYHVLWKNFLKNWKDYLLIIICSIVLFTISVVTFSIKELLENKYGIKKIQNFNGLSEILINAMLPIAIFSVFLIVVLVFYYLKTRARNYGIFLTLGMQRKTLYYITALEFTLVFLLSLCLGGFIGRIITSAIIEKLQHVFEFGISIHDIGNKPFGYSILAISAIIIISFMAARDIFYDFNIGKAEDVRAIAENIPGNARNWLFVTGALLCIFSLIQYGKLINYENEHLLFIFFIGLYLCVRNGIAIWLLEKRKKKRYIQKLLLHNSLFHHSKTNAGFITILTIVQFCILFYFSFQLISVTISEDVEELFPYDFVCLADDNDNKILKEIKQTYQVDVYEFPLVRVSAYDSTEELKMNESNGKAIQGQHIGIGESSYHQLKKLLDPFYQKTDLGLSDKEKAIYLVYQQDKSTKAQPTAFYIPKKKPLLHIGRPCSGLNPNRMHAKYDNGYYYYEITGEEIGTLIGTFHQGIRENIIVFSDEYFEKAKEFWKSTNIRTGEPIEEEEMRIPDLTIAQGVTKLILINTKPTDLKAVGKKLEHLNQSHLTEENEIYKTITPFGNYSNGIYDSSVSYLYRKQEAMESIQTERIMKVIMSIAAILLFTSMSIMLIIVKMLSEFQMNVKRSEFLHCMGMRQKERLKLLRDETVKFYCNWPVRMAVIFSGAFIIQVFRARMYTLNDITGFLKYYIPAMIIYSIIYKTIIAAATIIYSKKIEKEAVLL